MYGRRNPPFSARQPGTGTEAGAGTGTGTLGLSEKCFQNRIARTCNAIHDLVEATAVAAGDAIPGLQRSVLLLEVTQPVLTN